MLVMRIGVLLCVFITAVCFAAQPEASTRAATDIDSTSLRQAPVRPPGPAPYFGPRLISHLDTTRVLDTLPRRTGLPSPFLDRFLTSTGFTAVSYGQWRGRLHMQSALRGDGRFYPNPSWESDPYYPYDSREMKTIGDVASWVVPFLLPTDDREVLLPERFDPTPGRRGWPYPRW